MSKSTASPSAPSSNWQQLKKKLPKQDIKTKGKGKHSGSGPSTKRKHGGFTGIGSLTRHLAPEQPEQLTAGPSRPVENHAAASAKAAGVVLLPSPSDKPLMHELRQMVCGELVLNEAKKAPGNYIAIDCEMVGLGHLGAESALARVSLVNYHGHVLLDTFVQPRERVTDWRTWVSGVRESDIMNAPPFDDVQKQVAKLVEGRILVGHAIDNDMKALLLSHPNPFVRDTQKNKQLREHAKTKRPGLKKLAELELGLKIQAGAHSSVTDARATMALYRLYKPEWEATMRHVMETYRQKAGLESSAKGKRKRDEDEDEEGDEDEAGESAKRGKRKDFPGGGRKGISSGLSVVVRRFGKKVEADQPRRRGPAEAPRAASGGNWWEDAAK